MFFSQADQYNLQAVCDDFKNSSIFGPKCTKTKRLLKQLVKF